MGIDHHAFHFLLYARQFGAFQRTATIGRQTIHIDAAKIQSKFPGFQLEPGLNYCEGLLTKHFGATDISSVDNSSYENATIVHNMNRAIDPSLAGQYKTVIDGGCLEHIFDVSRALANCSTMCAAGGQILHILPANNFCGHGFWQFSPELFFSLYNETNGYRGTEVFLAELKNRKVWYRVSPPTNGRRVNVKSNDEVYVLVRTVKVGSDFSHQTVQQSDYVFEWTKNDGTGVDESGAAASSAESLPTKPKSNSVKQLYDRHIGFRIDRTRIGAGHADLTPLHLDAIPVAAIGAL